MNRIKQYSLKLDFVNSLQYKPINLVQYDAKGSDINMTLTSNKVDVDLTGCTVDVEILKVDKTVNVTQLTEITGNVVTFTPDINDVACVGKVLMTVTVYKGDGKSTSIQLFYNVKASLIQDDSVTSSTAYPILDDLILQTTILGSNITAAEGSRTSAENARVGTESSRVTAEVNRGIQFNVLLNNGVAGLSCDVEQNVVTTTSTNISIISTTFNPVNDVLIAFYNGEELSVGLHYSLNINNTSIDLIDWTPSINDVFDFKIFKNSRLILTGSDGSILQAKSVNINALSQTMQDNINQVPTNTANIATNTASLADIMQINAKQYGAKGDGTTIDTTSIIASITALQDGSNYILPKGQYILDNRIIITKNNCNFYFYGTFKMANGIATPYGLITMGGTNNKIYNLNIDGNSGDPTTIDCHGYGITANLVIGTSASNLSFYNTTLVNSIYSATIYNGKASNILFDTITYKNLGEHCNYISGGLNDKITYKNVYIENIGLKSDGADHEGYFIKSRGDSYGNNTNFLIDNVRQYQNIVPQYVVFCIGFFEADNWVVRNVSINGYMYGFEGNDTTGIVTIDNFSTKGCIGTYGKMFYTNLFINSDITVRNSYISGYQTELNSCHNYINCTLNVDTNTWTLADTTSWVKIYDTIFSNCTFIFSIGRINYDTVTQNVFFRNCDFITTSTTVVANGCVTAGVVSFNPLYTIEFNGGTINTPNYTYSFFAYNSVNLKMNNMVIAKMMKGSFNNLTLTNFKCASYALVSACTYVHLIAYNVYYTTLDYTRTKFQTTIPISGTTSPTTNTQYTLIRPVVLGDVIVTPVGDVGSVRYYPVVTGYLVSVVCTPACATAITFNVVVSANA
jgi:hypothetical protein